MTSTAPRHFSLLGTLALAAVLALSCGSSTAKSTNPIHSCNLIGIQEIEGLIGAAVDQPPIETHKEEKDSPFWMSMCNWYAPDPGISLGVMIRPVPAGQKTLQAAYDAYAKSMQENMPDYKMVPVEGVGTIAAWNGPAAQLTIFHGSHAYIVTVMIKNGAEKAKLDLAQKTGQLVLSKMK